MNQIVVSINARNISSNNKAQNMEEEREVILRQVHGATVKMLVERVKEAERGYQETDCKREKKRSPNAERL